MSMRIKLLLHFPATCADRLATQYISSVAHREPRQAQRILVIIVSEVRTSVQVDPTHSCGKTGAVIRGIGWGLLGGAVQPRQEH